MVRAYLADRERRRELRGLGARADDALLRGEGVAARGGAAMSDRAVPFHCPYCGDEDLRPHETADTARGAGHGAWECRACLRAFSLRMLGLLARPEADR